MKKKGKVLVTGANGLLGSHIVRELLADGYRVRILVRKESDRRAIEGLTIELTEGQITQKGDIEKSVEGCDFVIHAAARTSQCPSTLEAFRKTNIESVILLMAACNKFRVKRLVLVSTANCFGNGTKENPGNEKISFLPWLKNSGYAYSKYLAQQMVLNEVTKNGLDAVVVNPTFIIGANDFKPSSGKIFYRVLNKRVVFYPPGGKNFVDAEMAAKGVVKALENGRKGECYLLAGENHSYKEFFKIAAAANRQKSVFLPIPKFMLMISGLAADGLWKIFKFPLQLTKTNAQMLCLENYFTAEKSVSELGFQILSTNVSVEKVILWLKSNNYFKKGKC